MKVVNFLRNSWPLKISKNQRWIIIQMQKLDTLSQMCHTHCLDETQCVQMRIVLMKSRHVSKSTHQHTTAFVEVHASDRMSYNDKTETYCNDRVSRVFLRTKVYILFILKLMVCYQKSRNFVILKNLLMLLF